MSERSDLRFMKAAVSAAKKGMLSGQTPFGAVIIKNGRLVCSCHNLVWKNTDITAHAEVSAIRAACKKLKTIDLSGCEIYSTCEPCPMCFSAIHWAGIKRIVYGASISDAKNSGFNELPISNLLMKKLGGSRLKLVPGIMKKECKDLFKEWVSRKDRKSY